MLAPGTTRITPGDVYETTLDKLCRDGLPVDEAVARATKAARWEAIQQADTTTGELLRQLERREDLAKAVAVERAEIDETLAGIEAASKTADEELDEYERGADRDVALDLARERLTEIYAAAGCPLPIEIDKKSGQPYVAWALDEAYADWFCERLDGLKIAELTGDPGDFLASLFDTGCGIEAAVHPRWKHLPPVNVADDEELPEAE